MRHTEARLAICCLTFFAPAITPGARGADDLSARARAVLQTHCATCHGLGGTNKGGFGHVLDRDRLVARGQVVPGDATASPLYQRIRDGEMPPPGKRQRPTADESALLKRWIEAGAPSFHPKALPSIVTEMAAVQAILTDLRALEPRRRRFTRYLTLSHLAAAGSSADGLRTHRHALAKLVNSLSWHPRISRPQPVDAARTIYRLDLRDYKWTARLWDRLAAVYPYRPSGHAAALEAVAALTGAAQPYLRGDWFVATAARPPFYHDFLQLPGTDRGLERLLLVDVAANIQEDNVTRAGFNGSGVAKNNRVLERHDAAHGAYWRSYDFSDNTGRQNIFERPLGPAPGPTGFTPAGGEIIFHLPNGLQGYLLVDAAGRRVDRAPADIVSDPKRPDRQVENGISCIGCHVRGLLPKDDQVRAHVLKNKDSFSRDDRAAVRALYVPAARLRALMKDDMERFARALAKTGVPADAPEPVTAVIQRYEGVLDVATAAAEAGRTAADFTARLRKLPEVSRKLGAVLTRGGTVQRQVFEEAFPDLARALGPVGGGLVEVPSPVPFTGHHGPVRALVFAPDGRLAVSGGADRTLRLWDAATGRQRHCCTGHSDEVLCVAFSPDGRHVLSGSADQSLRLWDSATGREVRRFTGHTDAVRAVAFAADGRHAISGGADRTLRLWDIATGKELACWTGHGGAVHAVALSPDGKQALSGGADRTVRLWSVATGKELRAFEGHTAAVYAVAFSRDGRRALSGGNDRMVRLWDVATGKELRSFAGHANAIVGVAFTPDGRRVLSGSSRYRTADRVIRLWDVATGRELVGLDGDRLEQVECVAFSPDGTRALLSHAAGAIRSWQAPKGK